MIEKIKFRFVMWYLEYFCTWIIRPGHIYEDCSYHPVLCTENDNGDLWGISLIDGTSPRGCSMFHCGPRRLSVKEAYEIKKNWGK